MKISSVLNIWKRLRNKSQEQIDFDFYGKSKDEISNILYPKYLSHENISEVAKHIWIRSGKISGRDEINWIEAQKRLMGDLNCAVAWYLYAMTINTQIKFKVKNQDRVRDCIFIWG